jgi:hypothetical protein
MFVRTMAPPERVLLITVGLVSEVPGGWELEPGFQSPAITDTGGSLDGVVSLSYGCVIDDTSPVVFHQICGCGFTVGWSAPPAPFR